MTSAMILALAQLAVMIATPAPTTNACAAYPNKMGICNERLARWLPQDTDAFDAWQRGVARLNTPPDPFVIVQNGKTIAFPEGTGLERRGRPFNEGVDAADPVHHIVFVHTTCCGADYRVLGRTDGPAPDPLPQADLSSVQTRSGVRLGMHADEVVARLGRTRMYRNPERPGITFLGYTSDKKRSPGSVGDAAGHCPYAMLIALQNDRVVSIALEQSC
jgi:hypothetical protein